MRRQRSAIPTRDRVLLSTWEKWVAYGRFPIKLVLHLALVLATTWQVAGFNDRDAAYVRAAHRNWYYYFFPADFDFESRNFYLYTVSDVVDAVARASRSYGQITTTSVDQLTLPNATRGTCQFPGHCTDGKLAVRRYAEPPQELFAAGRVLEDEATALVHEEFWLTEGDLGPLDFRNYSYAEVRRFLQEVVDMRLVYYLVAHGPRHSGRSCVVWEVELRFDFAQRGQMNMMMASQIVDDCMPDMSLVDLLSSRVHQLNLVIVVLSSWSLLLSVRSILTSARLLFRIQRRYRRRHSTPASMLGPVAASRTRPFGSRTVSDESLVPLMEASNEGSASGPRAAPPSEAGSRASAAQGRGGADEFEGLSWQDKLRFFNPWFALTSVACVVNISSSLACLIQNRQYTPPNAQEKLMLGLGCSMLWVNLIAFLTHKPSYYTIVLTLSRALPRVTRFLLGVMPILLGYALFGMLYFGDHSDRFGSFGMSMITLFAVLNGDVIRETFMDLVPTFPVISQVYLYTFICLFIYVVLNVFIAIVEESFFSTRAKARSLELFAKHVREQEDAERRTSGPGDAAPGTAATSGAEGVPRPRPLEQQRPGFAEGRDRDDGSGLEGRRNLRRGDGGSTSSSPVRQLKGSFSSSPARLPRQYHTFEGGELAQSEDYQRMRWFRNVLSDHGDQEDSE